MKMNLMKRLVIGICSCIPWLFYLPYMVNSWRYTPLDRQNWIFVILFLGLLLFKLLRQKSLIGDDGADAITWVAVGVSVVLLLVGCVCSVHFIGIVGGICFFWSGIRLALGRETAKSLVFACAILFLATPSTTYLLGSLLRLDSGDALLAKYVFSVICLGLSFVRIPFHLELLAFVICLVAAFALYYEVEYKMQKYPPLKPDFGKRYFHGDYLGREIEPSASMVNFFKNSDVSSFQFADKERNYHVIAIKCGKDIHEIHPASHCLRSSGRDILSESQRIYRLGGIDYSLLEIIAEHHGGQELFVVWYSTDDYSVGSFFSFRKFWSTTVQWYTWQVSLPLSGNLDETREQARRFIETITGLEAHKD